MKRKDIDYRDIVYNLVNYYESKQYEDNEYRDIYYKRYKKWCKYDNEWISRDATEYEDIFG